MKADGRTVASGKLPALDIAPGQEKEFNLPLPKIDAQPGVEYWLNISFALKHETAWAPLGHEIAWDQFALPVVQAEGRTRAFDGRARGEGRRRNRDHHRQGLLRALRQEGRPAHGVSLPGRRRCWSAVRVPDFWRAPTNNDRGAWKVVPVDRPATNKSLDIELWREAGPRWDVKEMNVEKVDASTVKVTVQADLPVVGATYAMTYTVHGDGAIAGGVQLSSREPDKLAMMPRFGTELVVAPGLENLAWYGRGPKETLVDRAFERIGVYRSTVDKEWVEYMRPQENGNKTDVRWVKLTNAAGIGIMATGVAPLNVTARHYTKTDMERAGYTFQMKRHPETYLNLDGAQMGAGGIDSWSPNAYPMLPYRIASGEAAIVQLYAEGSRGGGGQAVGEATSP